MAPGMAARSAEDARASRGDGPHRLILTCDLRAPRTRYLSFWWPRTASAFFAALRKHGILILHSPSLWKRNVLIPVVDRKIEAPLAPVLCPPFSLGFLDTLPR